MLIVCTAMSVLALGALPRTTHADLVWENYFTDEASIVDGSSITTPDGTVVTFDREVFSDNTGGTFDLDPYRNNDYLTFEQGPLGGHFGHLEFSMNNDNNDPDDYVELSLNFDRAITDLEFSLLDVDSGNWDDGVEVFYNGNNNVRDNAAISVVTGAYNGIDNESYMNGWEGYGRNAGNGQTAGNIDFDFGSIQITSLRIRYFSTDDARSNPGGQVMGVSDLIFVEAVPEASSLAYMAVFGAVVLLVRGRRRSRIRKSLSALAVFAGEDADDVAISPRSMPENDLNDDPWTVPFPAGREQGRRHQQAA